MTGEETLMKVKNKGKERRKEKSRVTEERKAVGGCYE
jgi:hypothetical protein